MNDSPLEILLQRLNAGDDRAAAEVFSTYEPYLRMVVRRLISGPLRARFDSVDVVQSVWADLLSGFRRGAWRFDDPDQLRAFLVTATRHRFLNQVRRCRRSLNGETACSPQRPIPAVSPPRPSEVVQADDLWRQMLQVCPPDHRPLLHLKRQGLSLAEMAAQTGLHPSSIRRIFYDLARRLAAART